MDKIKRKRGRPTLLTRKRLHEAVELAKAGETKKDIAAHLGITTGCIHDWLRQGKRARIDKDERGIAIPRGMRLRAEFSESLARASAEFGRDLKGVLLTAAANGDWRPAWELLKAHDRPTYGDHTRTELSGPDGGPVELKGSVDEAIAAAVAATRGEGDG